jgi:hypothetical protein
MIQYQRKSLRITYWPRVGLLAAMLPAPPVRGRQFLKTKDRMYCAASVAMAR